MSPKNASGEQGMTTPADPAIGVDATHGRRLVAGPTHNPVNNGADVLSVRLATGSLSAAPTENEWTPESTGGGSHSTTGEPGAAGAPPHPFSHNERSGRRCSADRFLTLPREDHTMTVVDREAIKTEIRVQELLLDGLRKCIGTLNAEEGVAVSRLLALRSELADSTPPERHRYVSRLGDRRERSVQCWNCGDQTWALDSLCDPCDEVLQERQAGGAA